jgi:hypothetical protein
MTEELIHQLKVVAEFDGGKLESYNSGTEYFSRLFGSPRTLICDLKYHTSFDWLMGVVDKIEAIKDPYHGHFGVYIGSNNCTIQSTNFRSDKRIPEPPFYYNSVTLESKIKSTFQAVYDFITWYNTIKNT